MSLRQRVPFRFSDHDEDDDRILDEQEQEELIQSLRTQSDIAIRQYLLLVQAVIGLSCLLHVVYLLKHDKESPLYALLLTPSSSAPVPIPLPALFAALHILLHANLSLLLLAPTHPIRVALSPLPLPLQAHSLPLPFSHPLTLITPALAPALALLLRRGWPEVLWWSVAGGLTWFVYSVRRWNEQGEAEIRELERMRYDARGA